MSLRVWLPLNGDLHNQGISNAIFSKTTNVWGIGKIGEQSLLTSTGTGNVMVNELKDKKEFSIAYWVKIDSLLTFSSWQDIWAVDYTNATGTYPIRDEHTNTAGNHQLLMAKETNVGSNTNGYIGMTIANAPNTWQHIILVKGLTQTKSYVDGKLKLTRNNTDFETSSGKLTGNVRVGAATCGAYLNDFRIYDHCLSTVEIKEISEGLVLHYKLNGPMGGNNSNLLLTKDSTYISNTKSFELQGWVMNLFTKTWMNENLVVGQKYTLSYKVTCISRPNGTWARTETRIMPILVHQGGGMNQSTFCTSTKTTDMQVGESKEFITTFTFATITESQEYYGLCMYTMLFNDGSSNQYAKFRIENLKLEEGDKVTSWCPNITELGINTTIIEDSSGYNHNGEILNGPLSFIKDTSRYDICTHFSATNQKIKLSNFSTSGFGNSYTFAWWAKISSVSPMHWGFANGIRLNGLYTGRLWNTGDSSNNPLYNPGTTTQVTAPSINEWHHWVMTGDGSKCLVYQDGELWAEAKTYKAISGTEIYINGWNANTDYSSNNYSVSDFRIYCTALSAEDIKELYQVSASIDKLGNIHTYDFNEDDLNNISNTGILHNAQLNESNFSKYLKYDPNVYIEPDGSCWLHIYHHNNPSLGSFASTNDFEHGVYIDDNRWFNVNVCNYLDKWELMVKGKFTNISDEWKVRWVQSVNPMIATYAQVAAANVIKITTDGYFSSPSSWGGLYAKKGSAYLTTNNSNSGNWWGAVGSYSIYQGGIPGWGYQDHTSITTTGFNDLYVRIDNIDFDNINQASNNKNKIWTANQFIEK